MIRLARAEFFSSLATNLSKNGGPGGGWTSLPPFPMNFFYPPPPVGNAAFLMAEILMLPDILVFLLAKMQVVNVVWRKC